MRVHTEIKTAEEIETGLVQGDIAFSYQHRNCPQKRHGGKEPSFFRYGIVFLPIGKQGKEMLGT